MKTQSTGGRARPVLRVHFSYCAGPFPHLKLSRSYPLGARIMNHRLPRYLAAAVLSVALGWMLGCSKVQPTAATATISDAASGDSQIISTIQGKLYADPSIQSKQISVDAAQGVVTLSGTVATDVERTQASAAAASVPGVKTVVNNIVVSDASASAPVQRAPAPEPVRASAPAPKPHANRPATRHNAPRSDDDYQAPSTV